MKKYRIPILVLTVLAAFSMQTCKNCNDPTNPDCANYNPCHDDQPPTAEFGIYEETGARYLGCIPDSEKEILAPIPDGWPVWRNRVTFKTEVTDYDSLTWQIGDHNQILRDPEVFLDFASFFGESMPITLTVYRTSRKGCYDESQSVVTSTKNLYFKDPIGGDPNNWEGPWVGKFFCKEETTGDTFTLSIYETGFFRDLTVTGFNSEMKDEPFDERLSLGSRSSTYSLTFCAQFQERYWHEYGWRQQRGTMHFSQDYSFFEMTYYEAIDPTRWASGDETNNKIQKHIRGTRIE
jgi:hypothetical protein